MKECNDCLWFVRIDDYSDCLNDNSPIENFFDDFVGHNFSCNYWTEKKRNKRGNLIIPVEAVIMDGPQKFMLPLEGKK